ncbi:MAG: ABC transporter permease [Clostridiales bacterium]|nr:ABC transporter permease [Clostridiales bacterium]
MSDMIVAALQAAISISAVYLFATLGEILTQRSGVMNLGVEGMIMMGAVAACITASVTESLFLAVLASMLVAGIFAALHAFVSVTLKSSQVVSGLALTILGSGLARFLGALLKLGKMPVSFENISLPLLGDIPYVGDILFNQNLLVYIGYVVTIVMSVVLFKTKLGIRIRAVGENPAAADAAGINVYGIRYACTIIGGSLAGLAGSCLALANYKAWETNLSNGAGWLAVALVIFALWKPFLAFAGSFLFGCITAMQTRLTLWGINIPDDLVEMVPYVLTIIVMILISGKIKKSSGGPAALGVPYDREER